MIQSLKYIQVSFLKKEYFFKKTEVVCTVTYYVLSIHLGVEIPRSPPSFLSLSTLLFEMRFHDDHHQ